MAYKDLPLKERHAIIKAGVANGVHKLSEIEARYNAFIADSTDYDMEAYARENPNDVFSHGGHYPDKFKKPNHPTFSDESIYHSEATPGGHWNGNIYEPSDYVLNQQGGWNNFLRNFQSQEQGTGAVPVFRGGAMLPEVEVHPHGEGGSIHIAPSKRGTFTAAATKHGKGVQEFARQVLAHKENYSPAMVKKANFARNAAHWHDDGGIIGWVRSLFGNNEAPVETPAPKPTGRVRRNDSPTQAASERLENRMHRFITSGETNKEYPVTTSTAYDIPYLMDKEIKVKGVGRVSSNALDSVAKYAAQAEIPLYEGLGLAAQETAFGAAPVINYIGGNTEHNRALGNASYFRNFGSIPAQYFVRDFEYDKGGRNGGKPYDRSIPPLLHAFEYWKQGNYNRGDANHTSDVKAKGKQVMQDASVKQWLKESGQRIYDDNKKSTGGPLYPFSFNKPLPPVRY